eukprot:366486-Chlamydomonas_euryale.AAC.15
MARTLGVDVWRGTGVVGEGRGGGRRHAVTAPAAARPPARLASAAIPAPSAVGRCGSSGARALRPPWRAAWGRGRPCETAGQARHRSPWGRSCAEAAVRTPGTRQTPAALSRPAMSPPSGCPVPAERGGRSVEGNGRPLSAAWRLSGRVAACMLRRELKLGRLLGAELQAERRAGC